MPLIYFVRKGLEKGTYLLFYRVAHRDHRAPYDFASRTTVNKLMVGMNVPKEAKVTMTRINTKRYGKPIFLELKRHYV